MHGLIHIVLKDLVVANFGHATWGRVLAEIGLREDSTILEPKQYSDDTTMAGVHAAVKVLGLSLENGLRAFGEHFVKYLHAGDHLRMLESMGDETVEFLRNLNHLHRTLECKMRQSRFPCFGLSEERGGERGERGRTRHSFKLSYASTRGALLAALVEGILPALGRSLHGASVEMSRQAAAEPGYDVTWRVAVRPAAPPALRRGACGGVADATGARRWGALWHAALACCMRAPATAIESVVEEQEPRPVAAVQRAPSLQDAASLASLREQVSQSRTPADVLMRAVPCSRVCSTWSDREGLRSMEEFWGSSAGDVGHFEWARAPTPECAVQFVSHSWFQPAAWHSVMGSKCSYAEMKGTELQLAAAEIAESLGIGWEQVMLWIDKCCIMQESSMISVSISLLEEFMERCDRMVVLLTWEYFERLWCVYEWASFLVKHPPENVTLCLEVFLRPSSRALYLESIRGFSVRGSKCRNESDREILRRKVNQHYVSEAAFETFARCTAVALIARAACRSASSVDAAGLREEYMPFVSLAEELGFPQLAAALATSEPASWRREALASSAGSDTPRLATAGASWQASFRRSADAWFAGSVAPVLAAVKAASVRPESLSQAGAASVASCRSSGVESCPSYELPERTRWTSESTVEHTRWSSEVASSASSA